MVDISTLGSQHPSAQFVTGLRPNFRLSSIQVSMAEPKKTYVVMEAVGDATWNGAPYKAIATSSDLKKVQGYVDDICFHYGDMRKAYYVETEELE